MGVRLETAGPDGREGACFGLILALAAVIAFLSTFFDPAPALHQTLPDRLASGLWTAFMSIGLLSMLLGRLRNHRRWGASGIYLFLLVLFVPPVTGWGAACPDCAAGFCCCAGWWLCDRRRPWAWLSLGSGIATGVVLGLGGMGATSHALLTVGATALLVGALAQLLQLLVSPDGCRHGPRLLLLLLCLPAAWISRMEVAIEGAAMPSAVLTLPSAASGLSCKPWTALNAITSSSVLASPDLPPLGNWPAPDATWSCSRRERASAAVY
jgi:hypothetical protein